MIELNQKQAEFVEIAKDWFFNKSSQVLELDGPAGTGKSVTMYAVFKALGLSEANVAAMSYTGQASIVMRTKGFKDAKSIHSTLYQVLEVDDDESELNKKFGLKGKRKVFVKRKFIDPNIKLFFIDEAYMVPKRMVDDILSFGIKVIACGDAHQLPPIDDDPGFLVNPGVFHLTELMRQSVHSGIIYLANRAMQGLPIHNGTYGDAMVISDDDLIPEMVGFADCICCGTNRTRTELNNWVRYLYRYTDPYPNPGERVICRNNNWDKVVNDISLANGLTGTVMDRRLGVGKNKDRYFYIDFKPDLVNQAFFDLKVDSNFFFGSIETKKEMKNIYVKYGYGEMFDWAYALTTHLSQGGEYNNGIYIEEFMRPQINNQLNYTGITRFKHRLIYVRKSTRNIYIPGYNNAD